MESAVSLNLNTTIGPYGIGVLVSYILFGVATAQTYIYYTRFPADSPKVKALVAFVWACEMGFTVCIGWELYVYTVIGYGRQEVIIEPSLAKPLDMAFVFDGLTAACVQSFFSFRIYLLSKKKPYIPILISILTLLRLLACFMLFVEGVKATSMANFKLQWQWFVTALSCVSTANNWTITATLCRLLHNHRPNAYKKTSALLNKLILWTIETGMLTSASAIVTVACSITMPGNFIYFSFYILEARCEPSRIT
ncbi:hypothetical protein K438DRAFT_1980720 [Mycena galopus ATCC 62051]|nr:hypothetical protein K438DRAFT_1980720 [Mycena galopus ATCC 62051]